MKKKRYSKLWAITIGTLGALSLATVTGSLNVHNFTVKNSTTNLLSLNNNNSQETVSSYLGSNYLINDSELNTWNLMSPNLSSYNGQSVNSLNSFNNSNFWVTNFNNFNGYSNDMYNVAVGGIENNFTVYQWFANNWLNKIKVFSYASTNTPISNSDIYTDPFDISVLSPMTNQSRDNQLTLLNLMLNNHFIINNVALNADTNGVDGKSSEVFGKSGLNSPALNLQVNPFLLNAAYNENLAISVFLNIMQNIILANQTNMNHASNLTQTQYTGSYGYPQFGSYVSLYTDTSTTNSASNSLIPINVVKANINWLYLLCLAGVFTWNQNGLTPFQQFKAVIKTINGFTPLDNNNLQNLLSSGAAGNANVAGQYFCPQSLVQTVANLNLTIPITISDLYTQYNNLATTGLVNEMNLQYNYANTYLDTLTPNLGTSALETKTGTNKAPTNNYTFANNDNNYLYIPVWGYLNNVYNWLNAPIQTGSAVDSDNTTLYANYFTTKNGATLGQNFNYNATTSSAIQTLLANATTANVATSSLATNENVNMLFTNYVSNFIQNGSYYQLPVGNSSLYLTTPNWFNNVLNYGITPLSANLMTFLNLPALNSVFNISYVTQTTALQNENLPLTNLDNTNAFMVYNLMQMVMNPAQSLTAIENAFNSVSGPILSNMTNAAAMVSNNLMEALSLNYNYWIYDTSAYYNDTTTLYGLEEYIGGYSNLSSSSSGSANSTSPYLTGIASYVGSGAVNWNTQSAVLSNYLGESPWTLFNSGANGSINFNDLTSYFINHAAITDFSSTVYLGIETNVAYSAFANIPTSFELNTAGPKGSGQTINFQFYNYGSADLVNGKNGNTTVNYALKSNWFDWSVNGNSNGSNTTTNNTNIIWENVMSGLTDNENNVLNVSYSNWDNLPLKTIQSNQKYFYQTFDNMTPTSYTNWSDIYNTNDLSTYTTSFLNYQYASLNGTKGDNVTYSTTLINTLTISLSDLLRQLFTQKSNNVSSLAIINGENYTTSSDSNIINEILNNEPLNNNSSNTTSSYFYNISPIFTNRYITQSGITQTEQVVDKDNQPITFNLSSLMQNGINVETVNSVSQITSNQIRDLEDYFNVTNVNNILTTNTNNGTYVGLVEYNVFDSIENGTLNTPNTPFYLYNLPYTAKATLSANANNVSGVSVDTSNNAITINVANFDTNLENVKSSSIIKNVSDNGAFATSSTISNSVVVSLVNYLINEGFLDSNYNQNLNTLLNGATSSDTPYITTSNINYTTPDSISFDLDLPTINFPLSTTNSNYTSNKVNVTLTGFNNIVAGTLTPNSVINKYQNEKTQQNNTLNGYNHTKQLIIDILTPILAVIVVAFIIWIIVHYNKDRIKKWVFIQKKRIK